jgi:hypothetical protein
MATDSAPTTSSATIPTLNFLLIRISPFHLVSVLSSLVPTHLRNTFLAQSCDTHHLLSMLSLLTNAPVLLDLFPRYHKTVQVLLRTD